MSGLRGAREGFELDDHGLPTWKPKSTTPYGLELELCAPYRGDQNHFIVRARNAARYRLDCNSIDKTRVDIEEESGGRFNFRLFYLSRQLYCHFVRAPWERDDWGGGGGGRDPQPVPSPKPSMAT